MPPKAPGLLDRDGLIGSEELARWLDVPTGTLDQWASRGGGPIYHKVGIHRKYHPLDVKSWLAEQRRATTSDPCPPEAATRGRPVSAPVAEQPQKGARRRSGNSARTVPADSGPAA